MSVRFVAETKSRQSIATTSRLSRWNHTNIFSDVEDEEVDNSDVELMESNSFFDTRSKAVSRITSKGFPLRSMKTCPTGKSLAEDLSDQLENYPLDLLDRQKTRATLGSSEQLKRKLDVDNDMEMDSNGRLVIREDVRPKQDESTNSCHDIETISRTSNYSNLTTKSLSEGRKRQKT